MTFDYFSSRYWERMNRKLPVRKNTKIVYEWKPEFDEQPFKWVEYQFTNNKKDAFLSIVL